MVGGYIIDIKHIKNNIYRLWCVDSKGGYATFRDECAVKVRDNGAIKEWGDELLGEEIWWQENKVMMLHDTLILEKVGNSYDPRHEDV